MKTDNEIREGATYRLYIKNGFTDKEAIDKIRETEKEMENMQFLIPNE